MKIKFKLHLLSSFVLTSILFSTGSVFACPTLDVPNVPYIIGNAVAAQGVGSTGTEVVAKEEIANQTRSGNANCSNAPSNTKKELTTKTYDHLKKNIVELFKSKYISPQKDIETATKTLKEKFFISKNESGTATEKIKNRMAFAAEVSAEAYSLAMQLRPLYQEDMEALKSTTAKGCNQTQSNAMMNRNIKAQIKMMAAQILIQIVQMEVDAVQQFIKEPPTLITLETNQTEGGSK